MASRRGPSKRPASSEEVECWSHAAEALSKLSSSYTNAEGADTIGRVNRLLSAWPSDESTPSEGYDSMRNLYKKLTVGLNEIRNSAERDVNAIDEAMERLDILIALRKASEAVPPEKRIKRPRAHSPSGTTTPTSNPNPVTRGVSITVPPRGSVGPPQIIPFSREPKARREALAKQLPLEKGRKVAFHPPQNPSRNVDGAGKDEEWILAVVVRSINQDKNRYEVQDPEPQEDGSPGACYNTTLRAIIPLPDPNASPENAAHVNAYPEFQVGSTVMALYPDTSCFYRAEVIQSPSTGATKQAVPMYKLKFEDDDDQEHHVSAHWVVEWPGT